MKVTDISELQKIAKQARKNILEQVYGASSGHPGGALSCIAIYLNIWFLDTLLSPHKTVVFYHKYL